MANKEKTEKKDDQVSVVSEELLKELERKAYERVCKAVGTTPEQIEEIEAARSAKVDEPEVEYDVTPIVVFINGVPMPAKGRAKRSVAEVILQAAGAKRNRLLEEKFGKTNELIMMRDGTLQARLVETIDASGLKVGG